MKILLLEPFFSGSHRQWAEGYAAHSKHEVKILSLPGRHWKWRMYGGAVSLAKLFLESDFEPDLLLATDMLDFTTFLSLTRQQTAHIPTAIYFHENQITYPWSPTDVDVPLQRNNQYGFLNYTSALTADRVFFNSEYHQNSFLTALPDFLKQFPDYRELQNVEAVIEKSEVLYLGMNLKKFDEFENYIENKVPILLWNHRWEYDKNPTLFFENLLKLKEEGLGFQLIILGEKYKKALPVFKEVKEKLKDEILHMGYVDTFEEYAKWLWKADVLPVTSNQDFFGGSVVEAIYCNCWPILPKRLAYPEHIPTACEKPVFYEKDENFYQILKNTILSFSKSQQMISQPFVNQYDWSNLVSLYDEKVSF